MSTVALICCVVCGVAVMFSLWAERTQDQSLRRIAKPAASAAFVGVGLGSGVLDSSYGLLVGVGLVLCLVGDVLLLWREQKVFLGGLVSFLLGHVAFAVAFLRAGAAWADVGLGVAVAAVVALPAMVVLLPKIKPAMKGPVIAYVVVISLMVGAAFGAWRGGATWLLPVGAVAFLLSDLSVAIDRFVAQTFANRAWGMPLYFASVVLIALTPAMVAGV